MPLISLKKQYYWLISGFLLHYNLQHLLINIIVINFYYKKIVNILRWYTFQIYVLLSLIITNILSNYIYPNHLKIGCSFLSIFLLSISLLYSIESLSKMIFIDILVMVVYFNGIFDSWIDNTSHICAFVFAFIFYKFLRSKKILKIFNVILLAIIVIWIYLDFKKD